MRYFFFNPGLFSMRNLFYATLLFLLPAATTAASDTSFFSISFYNQSLELPYPGPLPSLHTGPLGEENLENWYQQLKKQWPHQALLNSIQQKKQQLVLNGWLYYELIRQSSKMLAPNNPLHQRLVNWLLLSESGYDTRITFLDQQIFLYAYTEDAIFDTPMIEEDSRRFVNLSSVHEKMSNPSAPLRMLRFKAMPYGRALSFQLPNWPALQPKLQKRNIDFSWQQQQFSLEFTTDATVPAFMQHYPLFAEQGYLEISLSPTLKQTLLPQLRQIIADKNEQEALEILVTFTRSAFQYKEDRDHFGKNKPMIADEVFHYPFSDCEDRSALFYNLVRSLLDLPMLIIAYPDHLTIAVALSEPIGPPIRYSGQSYYICDPTGPVNSSAIGQVPEGFEKASFEILGQHK